MKEWAVVKLIIKVNYSNWTDMTFTHREDYNPLLYPKIVKLFDSEDEAVHFILGYNSDEFVTVAKVKDVTKRDSNGMEI